VGKRWNPKPWVKLVDSRPARSAGRVKKSCLKTLGNFCECYKGSLLSFEVIKIHHLACGRVLDLQKYAKRKFHESLAKTSFIKLVIVVIWSVTPTFHFFLFVFILEKSLSFVLRKLWSLKHSANVKKSHKQECAYVRFAIRTMYNLIVFISKLSSVTVGFLVKNAFGVSWKGCLTIFKRFWSLDQGRSCYLKRYT